MSSPQIQIAHYSNRKCKFSESVDLKINGKTLITPTFAPRLKNDGELKVYSTIRREYTPRHISAYVVRLLDVGRTLHSELRKSVLPSLVNQMALDTAPQLGEQVLLIDPALEYMYYGANMERLAKTPFVSSSVRTYVSEFLKKSENVKEGKQLFRDATHTNFWTCIDKDANKRMKLIRDTFNVELRSRADVLIPPVPFITSPYLLDLAISMNEKSRAFSAALSQDKRECADYFSIKPSVLRNARMMSTIKEYVSISESPLTIFKFKNLNLNDENMALERKEFKDFLLELSLVSQHTENKAYALFEAGNQVFPTAISSFAVVSTGLNLDREDRRKEQKEISPFMSRYDPTTMTMQSKDTFLRVMENNDNAIPCYCKVCSENPSVPVNDFMEYNRMAREHYLLCRENEMNEITTAIEKQDVLMGFEKLQRSALKNLTEVIPR